MRINLYLIVLSVLLSISASAQTLVAGDIAIIGMNEDSGPTVGHDHSFTFIALKDIPAGEVIYFTEQGWNNNNAGTPSGFWMGNTEGHFTWTAPPGGVSCGTIIRIYETGTDTMNAEGGGTCSGMLSGNWNLSGGDQIIAYYSAVGARPAGVIPTFITALHLDDSRSVSIGYDPATTWSAAGYVGSGTAASHVPPGLTNGTDCIALFNPTSTLYYENDNVRYSGSLTGTAAVVRAAILQSIQGGGSWDRNNSPSWDISPSAFTPSVSCAPACTNPDVPTVTFTPATVCNGNNATLNISGSLNDATAWHVYSGTCGGTSLGTTAGTTFTVTPGSPSTTYFVRGEGGCVTPGSCGSVVISTTTVDDASFNYSAASYCADDADPTPTITGTPGGSFSSTAGLSLNSSTGAIDVSASTPGTYTVTYTTAGACPANSNVAVTINALDDASFSYSAASYCVDDTDPTPTITGLGGGGFTSTPVGLSLNPTTGLIDVSLSTPGAYTVTYTTTGSCPSSSNVAVTINALDDPSFSYSAASYCTDDADPTPTITGLGGGGFTSTPVGLNLNPTTGLIDVSASTPGSYTVTYTTTGACVNSSNVAVTVNALDDASFSYSAASYCVDDTDPTPTITGLGGGSFSSTAGLSLNASTGAIDVSLSTPGSYTVTYTTTGACANSSNVAVTINALDDPSFSYSAASYCGNGSDPTPTITGLGGGSFSSTAGLSLNASTGSIDVSASTPGTYTVTYTTAGACSNSSNVSVTINATDDASFSYSAAGYCVNDTDPTPTITGLAGGSFSSTAGLSLNASTGLIDVSASTPGTYTVTYTTTGSCPANSNVAVTINALDDASFSYSAASYCVDDTDPTPTITGLTGGTFSSTAGLSLNASTGAIDVSLSTPGTYTVTYSTAGICANSSNVSVTINGLDDASFSYSAASYCVNVADPTPTITGLAGGGFTSTPLGLNLNPTTGLIDVSTSVPGTYTVTYTTTGACPNSSNVAVTINALDDASFSYSTASYCLDDSDPTPTITGLAGGSFSSTAGLSLNASTGAIDLSASTPGPYFVTYSTAGTCANSSNVSIAINGLDDASFSYSAASYCSNDADPTPTITGTAGGSFSSTAGLSLNTSTGALDLSASTPGTYTITYTTAGACPSSSNVTVTINGLDNASFNYSAASYCVDGTDPTPTITGLGGGSFSSTAGLSLNTSTGAIDVSASTPGTYSVTYTTNGTCATSSNVSVTINGLDDASFSYGAASYCIGGGDASPTITGLAGGTFSSTAGLSLNASTGVIDVNASTAGTYTVTYTTNGSCPNSSNVSVTIDPAGTVAAVCQDLTIYLDASGSATIVPADIDNGSSVTGCGTLNLTASRTSFDCNDLQVVTPFANSLVISGVYDGPLIGGTPKGVELYVLNDIADLSIYGIGSANNGGGTDGQEFTFPAVAVSAGSYIYISSEATQFTSWFGNAPDYSDGSMGINGDDAVELFENGAVIDVFGDINVDGTGEAWEFLDGWAYRNSNTGPDGSTFNVANWSFSGINALDGETTNASAATPVPVGTYTYAPIVSSTVQVTLTADNGAGVSDDCIANVTVMDTIAPVAVCQDITVYLDGSGTADIVAADIDNGSSDNCGITSMVLSTSSFTCNDLGSNTVTFTVSDNSGNTSMCSATVTVADTTSPVVTCQDVTVYLDGTGNATITTNDIDNGSSDNCSVASVVASQTSFTCADIGANTVTLTVTDDAGNVETCTSTVTVADTTSPAATCQDLTVYLDGAGNAAITAGDVNNGSTDNCGIASMSISPSSFTCAEAGANTVTLTVTDVSGNTSTCTSTVTVADTTDPVAVCQDLTVYLDNSGDASIAAADIDNGSSDNCGITSMVLSTSSFTCNDLGSNTVTFTVSDDAGNTSMCTATVTVADTTSPAVTCQDVTVYLDGTGNATITTNDIDNGSSDNCSVASVVASQTSFTCADIGANTVTLTVTDDAGNVETCTSTVTVADTTSPAVTCQDLTVYLDGAGNAAITAGDIDNGSTDNCGVASMSISPSSFTCAEAGANTVTLTVTDVNGNTSTCTSTVTVADTTDPVAVCQDLTVYLDNSGDASIVAADIDNGSSDNCGVVSTVASQTSFTCADLGANTVTLSVEDAAGNTATCDATVTVMDTISPVASCQDITAYLDGTGNVTITAGDIDNGSSDNCSVASAVASQTSFTCADLGAHTVTLTVTDAAGNSSSCSATVTIADTVAPIVTCPGDQTETISAGCDFTLIDYTSLVTATDNCGGVTVTQSPALGTVVTSNTVVTMTAEDAEGNISTCTFTVILDDPTGPTITCPGDQTETPDVACNFTLPDYTALATANDNCGAPTVTQSPVAGTVISGTTTITLTAEDAFGNTADCSFDVILPPGIVNAVCQDVTVYLDASGTASIIEADINGGTTSNGCGILNITASQTNFDCTDLGVVAVDLVADNGAGVYDTCVANITVLDTISPIMPTLADITVACGSSLPVPTTTDNCAGTISATTTAVLPPALGSSVITWVFDDGNGNVISVDQNVTAVDGSSPIPAMSPLPTVTGACSVSLPTAPTANDACAGVITGTPSSTGPWDVAGTHVITWTYDDGNGNTTTQPQTIIVTDTEAPVADAASLPDVNEDCSANPTPPTATDNCAGTITGVSDLPLPITDGGTHVITWTFDDGNGNAITQTQNVTVVGINTFVTVGPGYVAANNTGADSYQWIDCSDMSEIPGETSVSLYPPSNGEYAVILTENGCTDTSYCVTVGGVGIDDIDVETFNIYPNPTTSGKFKVDYEGVIRSIRVIDMLGREIALSVDVTTGMVDGSSLADGKYTVQVVTEERGILTQFISVIK